MAGVFQAAQLQVAVRFIVAVDGGVDVGVSGPPAYFELGDLRPAPDPTHPDEQDAMLADYQKSTGVPFTNRTPEQIAAWLDSLQIQPPGLVPIDEWRPAPETEREPMLLTYGVLARKPIDG